MGVYINPQRQTKEQWLEEHALFELMAPPPYDSIQEEECLVCWVHNGPFTAAGIITSENEYHGWLSQQDPRPKRWVIVPKADIIEVMEFDPFVEEEPE